MKPILVGLLVVEGEASQLETSVVFFYLEISMQVVEVLIDHSLLLWAVQRVT